MSQAPRIMLKAPRMSQAPRILLNVSNTAYNVKSGKAPRIMLRVAHI